MTSVRSAEIALFTFGVAAVIVGLISLYYPHYPGVGNDTTPFFVGMFIGITMITLGMGFFFVDNRNKRKGV